VPPRSPAGLSTQPAHRRERPRSASLETYSAPFKGSFTSVCRRRNDEPGWQRTAERVSDWERGADRVTIRAVLTVQNTVRDRVHGVVQIAGIAGATKVAMHRYTEAVTADVRSRGKVVRRRTLACGQGASLRSFNSARPRGRVKGALRRSLVTLGRALDPPARSRRGWLLPERRRSVSLHLDRYAEFDHALETIGTINAGFAPVVDRMPLMRPPPSASTGISMRASSPKARSASASRLRSRLSCASSASMTTRRNGERSPARRGDMTSSLGAIGAESSRRAWVWKNAPRSVGQIVPG